MRIRTALLLLGLLLLSSGAQAAASLPTCNNWGGYPWQQGGCLNSPDINNAVDLSINSTPPRNDFGMGALIGHEWLDVHATPAVLRMCVNSAGCSTSYVPTDWATVCNINFTTRTTDCSAGVTGITQLIGDATAGPGSGTQTITLNTVNSTAGTFTIPILTVNGKGLVTHVVNGGTITFTDGLTSSINPYVGNANITAGLAPIADQTSLGNVSGGMAAPTALTKTQLTTLINTFTDSLSGAVPPGGGVANTFLEASTHSFQALPVGSTSVFGVFKIDGTTMVAPGGVLSAVTPTGSCIVSGAAGIVSNNGSSACVTDTNATLSDGALSLGASGTAGSVTLGNATSGTVSVQPVTGALGTVTASLPANTGTIAETNFAQEFTAQQTFNAVLGSAGNGGSAVSGTTYTFVAADCGTMVVFTSATTVTATIPAAIVPATKTCSFAVLQAGAGKVSVNGSAVTPATLISDNSYTGTSGTLGNMIGLTLLTVGASTNAYLTGSGS